MKNLAQYFLLSSFLLLSTHVVIAQDCKTKTDPFTAEKIISFDFMNGGIVFEHIAGKTFLKVKMNLDGEINMVFQEGTPFLLKTKKEKIINLTTSEKSIPVSQVVGTLVKSQVVFVCELNDDQLADLKESEVVLIRHADGKGSQYDLPIKKKFGVGFKDGADCMLKSK